MKKLIIIFSIIGAGIFSFFVVFNVMKETKNDLPDANTRMVQEKEYMDTLSKYIEQVDSVTAAYIAGEMDKEAYLERHQILKDEYEIIKAEFTVWQNKHPFKTGTESYISTRGEQAVKDANDNTDKLLACTIKDGEPLQIYELTYRYMDAKDKIETNYIEYVVAYRWLTEKDTIEEDLNKLEEEFQQLVDKQTESTSEDTKDE